MELYMEPFMKKYKCSTDVVLYWFKLYLDDLIEKLVFDDTLDEAIESYYKSLGDTTVSFDDVELEMFCDLMDCLNTTEQIYNIMSIDQH